MTRGAKQPCIPQCRRSPRARLAKKSDNDDEEQEKSGRAVADVLERLPGSTLGDEVPEGLANQTADLVCDLCHRGYSFGGVAPRTAMITLIS